MIAAADTGHPFTLHCDVLPIVRLARWAAQAGHLLAELRASEAIHPPFAAMVNTMLGGVPRPDPTDPVDLLADTLFVVEAMLETYVANQGGEV